MRKKIINFLNSNKIFRYLLPVFHILIGKNIFKVGKNNSIESNNANLYKNKFDIIYGEHNTITIGNNSDLTNSYITIKGSHNKIKIGSNCFVNGLRIILEGNNNEILLEDNVFVLDNTRVYVVDGGLVILGNGCMLSDNIEIRATDNHSIIDLETGKRINYEKTIILHSHVWLGTGVTLLKGSEIAAGCIVGAKSVITKKYDNPNTIIAGNPAKEIRNNVDWKMERI